MAAIEAMKANSADERGRYWRVVEQAAARPPEQPQPVEQPRPAPEARPRAEDAAPVSTRNPLYQDPPLCEKAPSGAASSTIGFTDETLDRLIEVEAALGREDPSASVRAIEGQVAAQLAWTKPPLTVAEEELRALLARLEAMAGAVAGGQL
jgi:hypothetical protein